MTSKNSWHNFMLDLGLPFVFMATLHDIPTSFTSIVTRFSDFGFKDILLLHEHWRLWSSIFTRMSDARAKTAVTYFLLR